MIAILPNQNGIRFGSKIGILKINFMIPLYKKNWTFFAKFHQTLLDTIHPRPVLFEYPAQIFWKVAQRNLTFIIFKAIPSMTLAIMTLLKLL